jgi:hypothetical protein
MEFCKRSRYFNKPRWVSGGASQADGEIGGGVATGHYIWEWTEEVYWEPCGEDQDASGSILGNYESARNGFGVKPGSLLPHLPSGPYWPYRPQDVPCIGCSYIKFQKELGKPPNPRGGVIVYWGCNGQSVIDRYVKIGNKWQDNPLLEQLGIYIGDDDVCDCQRSLNLTDYDEPYNFNNDPDGYDCNEKLKELLRETPPSIFGCDEETKKMITKALFDMCKNIQKALSSQIVDKLYNRNWEPFNLLIGCMSDMNMMKRLKAIQCGPIMTGEAAWTDTFHGHTQLDIDFLKSYSDQNSFSFQELLSQTMLHEYVHHCCQFLKEQQLGYGDCLETDMVLLGIILNGQNSWNAPTDYELQKLCDDIKTQEARADLNAKLANARIPFQFGRNWIISNNFMIDTSTGNVYAAPFNFDPTGKLVDLPIMNFPPPSGGYSICNK